MSPEPAVVSNLFQIVIADLQPGSTCSDDFKEGDVLTNSNFLFELATSSVPLGILLSSLIAGNIADKFGRLVTVLILW